MKEIVFINRHSERWKKLENDLQGKSKVNPDEAADLYVQLTDDLSYSRTYFPKSNITSYLNQLTFKAHQVIFQNKKEKGSTLVNFWKYRFPVIFYENRNYFFYALTIFAISILIGIVSTRYDDTFVRLILGDTYINMTLSNIEKGDPMAVYKQVTGINMFLAISVNNIYVSFLAFIAGLLFSFGTAYILLRNGIMLGAFQYFFHQHDLLRESFLTIWIHGTLEIFAIVVAGGAGLILGNSILFPGTYSRLISFRKGVNKGIKIMTGLIPVFAVAALLEGFVTRHTEYHPLVRAGIIVSSIIFIVWYFFIYPYKLITKSSNHGKRIHQF